MCPLLTQKFNRDAPDYEKSLRVIVKANDRGTPSLEGTCAFTVTVTDVNDNTPLFDKRVSQRITITIHNERELHLLFPEHIGKGMFVCKLGEATNIKRG